MVGALDGTRVEHSRGPSDVEWRSHAVDLSDTVGGGAEAALWRRDWRKVEALVVFSVSVSVSLSLSQTCAVVRVSVTVTCECESSVNETDLT